MAVSELTSTHAELVALAKDKLAMPVFRAAEVDHLIGLLERGERVVTFCDALFRSGRQEWRGLIVLTDERLICVDIRSQCLPLAEFGLPAITSVEVGAPVGSGDARRGQLTMLSDGVESQLARVRPWERAAEIARHIGAAITARS